LILAALALSILIRWFVECIWFQPMHTNAQTSI
jgi:hypothetical protein